MARINRRDQSSGLVKPRLIETQSAQKTAGDAVVIVAERIVSQASQFVIFILAARVLGPAEFGIFALASACAMLLRQAAEAGWAPFILSQAGDETVPLQVLFIAVLSGLIFGVAGGGAAVVAGGFGLSADIVALLLHFALWVALATAWSAQTGVMVWMGRLKSAAWCEIVGELAGLTVAVVALTGGAGVFALVYGRITCQTVALIFGFAATRRPPLPGLARPVMRELWVFSSLIFSSRMLVYLRLHFITLIVGAFLGPAAVGFFRAAERMVGAVFELIVVPGQLLAWTQFRRARDMGPPQEREARVNSQVARHLKMVVVLGAPLLLWLILMSTQIVRGLLGNEWQPVAELVAILALGRLLLFLGILTEPLMSLMGAARRLPGFMALIFVISVALTLSVAPFGVRALAWSQTVLSAIIMGATIWLFWRHAGVKWRIVWGALRGALVPLVCGTAAVAVLNLTAAGRGLPDLVEAAAFGLIGGAVQIGAIAIFDRAFGAQLLAALRLSSPNTSAAL